MQDFKQMTVAELSALTASNSAVPGGGSISALVGAYAASLVSMVAKLTLGKAKYAEAQDAMEKVDQQSEVLRLKLLEDIQRDSASFDSFMQALTLPKNTEEEKALRQEAMQIGLKSACEVPLATAYDVLEVLKLSHEVIKQGNLTALSDGLVGAMLARSALLGAVSNVRINLSGIKDETFNAKMNSASDKLEKEAHQLEERAIQLAKEREASA